jgi:DNA replication licensing factor MCM4
VHPVITEEASQELVQSYVKLRSVGDDPRASSPEKRITATTRQLESMIRLAEAHARMRLSARVELRDVQEAYRLMRDAIRASALDPTTGKIDMGLLNTGTGQQQRRMREDMRKEVLNLLSSSASASSHGIRWADAIQQLANQSSIRLDAGEFKEVIGAMEAEGLVIVVGIEYSSVWILPDDNFSFAVVHPQIFACYLFVSRRENYVTANVYVMKHGYKWAGIS